jgi:glycerophosphoryl diester phosphodiesterase
VAHRCGGRAAPENSLAGLDAAAKSGFRAVEFDVMLSADQVAMVIHDETLDRTCERGGRVAELSAATLQGVKCNRGWSGRFADQTIPTLDQVLERCRALELLVNVEIKPSTGADVRTGRAVAGQVLRSWQQLGGKLEDVLLSSFSTDALLEARRVAPTLARAWLVNRIPRNWPEGVAAVGAGSLHCSAARCDAKRLAEVLAAGLPVRCYTVNDRQSAGALFSLGVQAVFTDALEEFRGSGKPEAAGSR